MNQREGNASAPERTTLPSILWTELKDVGKGTEWRRKAIASSVTLH